MKDFMAMLLGSLLALLFIAASVAGGLALAYYLLWGGW